MATFRKRGDKWQARIQRRGQPDISKSFLTKQDALTWSRGVERDLDLGVYAPPKAAAVEEAKPDLGTLGDLLRRYREEVTPTKRSARHETQWLTHLERDALAAVPLAALTAKAAEVERGLAASQYRFGACRAYHALVTRRIAELRERRLSGIQTIEEFMGRRFTPAVATCASASERLHELSRHVAQASALLTTRVEIAREKQNQDLLASMARRATLQLRLQQTVEILSVAPLTYYVVAIVGYGAKALKAAGLPVEPEIAEGVAIPIVALALILAMRWVHHRVFATLEHKGPDLEL